MSNQNEIEMIAQALSNEGGSVGALTAAVIGILQVARGNPDIAKAVSQSLELHYSNNLAQSQNPHYMQGFELTRDYILDTLK